MADREEHHSRQRQQIGAKAALGQPLSETTSSTASSGQSSQIGSR
jgi:hypothetical protein